MKGTTMAVMVGGTVTIASAACNFPVPQFIIQKGARMDSFSCDLSDTCCSGLQDVEHMAVEAKGGGKPKGAKGRAMKDLVGTCGRADQVDLYKCAVDTWPKLVPEKIEGRERAMIRRDSCDHVQASVGTDGSGHCSLHKGKGKGTFEIDGVSTGCCDRAAGVIKSEEEAHAIYIRGCHDEHGGYGEGCQKAAEASNAAKKEGLCGMIGACGKKDQLSVVKFAKGMMKGKGKGGGPHPGELELLETTFNMTLGGAQQMMATFMTSEAEDDVTEDDVTEDDATEDGSHIVTGLLGFVAGAAVTGLGVTFLRRRTPSSQDEYNEIVA